MKRTKQIQDWQLRQRQALPLEQKVMFSRARVKEWVEKWGEDNCYVSFSGGKDSTVLLHLVRELYPDLRAVFVNTGLEYPEIVEFVRKTPNIQEIRPEMDFLSVVRKCGYPVVSKRVAQYVKNVQRAKGATATVHLRTTGFRKDGTFSPMGKVPNKWQKLFTAPFRVSDMCCKYLKKNALDAAGDNPIIGTMASDGQQRELSYLQYGCNSFDTDRPRSAPLSIWLEADIWGYIKTRGLEYSRIYRRGAHRTGCMFCMFGLHLEQRPNRFDIMQLFHPELFKWCMDGPLGLREVIRFTYGMEFPELPDFMK